nr:anhydro-N-acetylmuramic acid kinase [uncultured Flavobacterium sp.]
MNIKNFFAIGVMSGTSLDGIDIAYIRFTQANDGYNYEIMHAETFEYENYWIENLKIALDFDEAKLHDLNVEYTEYLSVVIYDFIVKYQIAAIDFIASHGHTIKHRPDLGYTLQIGNLPGIKKYLPYPIVCDFRVQDVDFGGQGAPLVPIGDALLFADYDYCLNLGGFSNVSFSLDGNRIAYDLSPVNTVLNFYANQLGLPYDDKGINARSGALNIDLLDKLNALPYYQKSYPKSLGLEFVNDTILPIIESFDIDIDDKMHTFTHHIAQQIVNGLPTQKGKLFITGGGVYNDLLIELIRSYGSNLEVIIPDALTIEFKEALIFAFLGLLRMQNKINVLSSVTGATHDHSSGKIFR